MLTVAKLCAVKPEAGGQRGAGGSGPRHVPSAAGTGLTVTVKASALNKAPTGKGSSKFRGVSWHKDNMKWRATIFKGDLSAYVHTPWLLPCEFTCMYAVTVTVRTSWRLVDLLLLVCYSCVTVSVQVAMHVQLPPCLRCPV